MCIRGSSASDEGEQQRRPPVQEMSSHARARFFVAIARDNRKVMRTLMAADERLRNSPRTASLYHHTDPLASPVIHEGDEDSPSPARNAVVRVVPMDSLDTALDLQKNGVQDIVVLNMANAQFPGGAYLGGAGAQEEALCRRSSLYTTLSSNHTFYPIPPHGAIYSPDVLVIRKSDDEWCDPLREEERWWTSVISVAAIFRPRVNETGTEFARKEAREEMRERIKTVLRVAALEGKRNLVLSALGCGAFKNPPEAVAQLFKEVLTDTEFLGRFEGVWFSILDRKLGRNYQAFHGLLNGISI